MKQKCDKKAIEILIIYNGVGICVYFVLMRFSHFSVPLYRNLMFFNFFCRAFLLQFLLIFVEIEELYKVRRLLGRSEGDVCGRLFASARHSQFNETPRSHVKKMEFSTFLKPVGENH